MKKELELKDLLQISDTDRDTLQELWKPYEGQKMVYKDEVLIVKNVIDGTHVEAISLNGEGEIRIYPQKDCLPLLNIGDMTEILFQYHTCIKMEVGVEGFFSKIKGGVTNEQYNEELCDALWKGIQYILQK